MNIGQVASEIMLWGKLPAVLVASIRTTAPNSVYQFLSDSVLRSGMWGVQDLYFCNLSY